LIPETWNMPEGTPCPGISGLNTDLYELTMMQGYFALNHNPDVVFDMFIRRQPFGGGFTVFAGLETLLADIEGLRFSKEDIRYLADLSLFHDDFLEYLSGFSFRGDIYAVAEGTPVFPSEPLIRVHGKLLEVQLIESLLLNTINFQSLIATKAARIYLASGRGIIAEFGLRRAQGRDGALSASRAAFIGGASSTSNTLAGRMFGIPVKGTQAHSWIMAFDSESRAFENYARIFPDNCILLIDTYDTLQSGLRHAIETGRRLKERGIDNFGVRLDSGDLEYLSKQVRRELDTAGLEKAKIVVSNELNEQIIQQLVTRGAPIDIWGVGTNLVTAQGDPALSGVFKLVSRRRQNRMVPAIKLSNNPEKTTNPGVKQVFRFYDERGSALADLMTLDDETIRQGRTYRFFHPLYEYKYFDLEADGAARALLQLKMQKGRIVCDMPDLSRIRAHMLEELERLDDTYKRLINPHVYKVSLSQSLKDLKFKLMKEMAQIP
jgi:nicotinate phosphoribosyltransferase